jgi:monothiol glutaredoxin
MGLDAVRRQARSRRRERAASDSPVVSAGAEGVDRARHAVRAFDVRTDEERAFARIDGSHLVDQTYHDALLHRDRDTPLVFQCHHGIRSQQAAEYFWRKGFRNLSNLQGGIDAWSLLVDPLVPRY